MKRFGDKFKKLRKLKILFKGQLSDYGFERNYKELYRVFANHDRIVHIDFVGRDDQNYDQFKRLSRKFIHSFINWESIILKTCKQLIEYLRQGVDFTGYTQEEKDEGFMQSLLAAHDIQAANWLWIGADPSFISEEGKNVTIQAIKSQMPNVIAYQLMHGEDPFLIPKRLRECVKACLPHPDLKNIFFRGKIKMV